MTSLAACMVPAEIAGRVVLQFPLETHAAKKRKEGWVAKFRKKPVVIEAVQLTWANWNEICEFVPRPWFVRGVWLDKEGNPLPEGSYRFGEANNDLGLIMRTLESNEFLAKGNDWIIRGINGEFYPCKPDIFAATYEAVEA